jgi:energy-coupling factor transporter transmembrane protein EcfT
MFVRNIKISGLKKLSYIYLVAIFFLIFYLFTVDWLPEGGEVVIFLAIPFIFIYIILFVLFIAKRIRRIFVFLSSIPIIAIFILISFIWFQGYKHDNEVIQEVEGIKTILEDSCQDNGYIDISDEEEFYSKSTYLYCISGNEYYCNTAIIEYNLMHNRKDADVESSDITLNEYRATINCNN